MRKLVGVTLSLLTISALVGCSASGDAPNEASAHGFSVTQSLSQLHRFEHNGLATIQMADLEAATQAAGLKRPTNLDAAAIQEWIDPLTGLPQADGAFSPVFVPLANIYRIQDHQEFADELGWSLIDVDTFVEQAVGPNSLSVVTGEFPDSPFPADLSEVADGVVTAGEGDDFAVNPQAATAARPMGAPLRLAHQPGFIAASPSTATVQTWLEGPAETQADHPELAAVAQALDAAEVYSAMLITEIPGSTQAAHTIGLGWSVADGQGVSTVVYHFPSEEDAQAALGKLQATFDHGAQLHSGEQLTDVLTLDQATSEGQLVTLTLSVAEDQSPGTVYTMFMNGDDPLQLQ